MNRSKIFAPFAALVFASLRMVSAGDLQTDGKFVYLPSSGPPLEVDSTELVVGLNADLLDGFRAWDFRQVPPKVIVVAQSGGDFTSIQAAINSITDEGPTNRYLISVAPGIYSGTVVMKANIDIEGSGTGITTITHGGNSAPTVTTANDIRLSGLTVEHTGGSSTAIGLSTNISSPHVSHVEVHSSGATGTSYGVLNVGGRLMMEHSTVYSSGGGTSIGVYNISASGSFSPQLSWVSIFAENGTTAQGMVNENTSSPVLRYVTVVATGATTNQGLKNTTSGSPKILHSIIEASTGTANSVVNDSAFANIAHSQLVGSVSGPGLVCVGAYDSAFDALTSACGP